jgi:dTDP-4-amino-4,6-dideoxygalactose transaminase
MTSFTVVDKFERRVADYAGSKYAVAVQTGTAAIFLSLKYRWRHKPTPRPVVTLPTRTFLSVPMAVIHAGGLLHFEDVPWRGAYSLNPFYVVDGALRFRHNMYNGGLHCLSFHARKILGIGEGGMILTDSPEAASWLRAARYSGRREPDFRTEDVHTLGWQMYMTPEKAARGLHLMDYIGVNPPDQVIEYDDLRKVPALRSYITSDGMRGDDE